MLQPTPKTRKTSRTADLLHHQPHAAFSSTMSDQIQGASNCSIDWSTMDLLDACYVPMLDSMGPNCVHSGEERGAPQNAGFYSSSFDLGDQDQQMIPTYDDSSFTLRLDLIYADKETDKTTLPVVESLATSGTKLTSSALVLGGTPGSVQTREVDRSCYTCGEPFPVNGPWYIQSHATIYQHPVVGCNIAGCSRAFLDYRERDAHQRRPHLAGHGRIETASSNDCVECKASLRSKADLLRHAKLHQHQPYACECGALFSRLDVLNRHLESFDSTEPKFPCKHCKRHRGAEGFRRLDHLMQHLRNYHHHEVNHDLSVIENVSSRLKYNFPVCHHVDCPQYRGEDFKQLPRSAQEKGKPFASQSTYTKHMREEHNESTFPCDVIGCTRVGRRGYFREKDLLKHRREQHPEAPTYQVMGKETKHRCTEAGCSAVVDVSSVAGHYAMHEWYK